ncbi:MAG: transglycosylase SLT domain-containing protein [Oligoflexia bacterium]|nr:transglycosylase SLT domain-containing protein [Oligoflexia bacterium]
MKKLLKAVLCFALLADQAWAWPSHNDKQAPHAAPPAMDTSVVEGTPPPTLPENPVVPESDDDRQQAVEQTADEEDQINIIEENKIVIEDLPAEGTIAWKKPDYSDQENALGWSPDAFKMPKDLEHRVRLWIDLYGKYSSRHAVFHDAKNWSIVYSVLDMTDAADIKEMQARIRKEKERILKILAFISKNLKTADKFEGETLEYYQKFANHNEPNKFKEAAKRSRVIMHAGQREIFYKGLYNSGRYIRQMEEIFASYGLPKELTRLPFVESMFNPFAYSRSRAAGQWQFIPSTWTHMKHKMGEKWEFYKMKGSPAIERRNDPEPSTHAAAVYLKFLYEIPGIGNWPFALTSYNQGPGTVLYLSKQLGRTKEISDIVNRGKARRFRHDGRNYYAQFLAALNVEAEADKYFGHNLRIAAPIEYENVEIPKPISFSGLAEFFKSEKIPGEDLARLYNPYLSRRIVQGRIGIPAGETLRVPKGTRDRFLTAFPVLASIQPKEVIQEEGVHVIRRGENLGLIANEWGVKIADIMDANNLSSKSVRRLRPGQKLVIPMPGKTREAQNIKAGKKKSQRFVKPKGRAA